MFHTEPQTHAQTLAAASMRSCGTRAPDGCGRLNADSPHSDSEMEAESVLATAAETKTPALEFFMFHL